MHLFQPSRRKEFLNVGLFLYHSVVEQGRDFLLHWQKYDLSQIQWARYGKEMYMDFHPAQKKYNRLLYVLIILYQFPHLSRMF